MNYQHNPKLGYGMVHIWLSLMAAYLMASVAFLLELSPCLMLSQLDFSHHDPVLWIINFVEFESLTEAQANNSIRIGFL